MLKSRQELRSMLCRIEAAIELLRSQNARDQDFFLSTDRVFQGVLTQCGHEDDDWLFNLIDQVCTRQSISYPATR